MAVPKKKVSRSRSKMRRHHIKCARPALSSCPNCKTLMAPHRACSFCGRYKGKEVVSVA